MKGGRRVEAEKGETGRGGDGGGVRRKGGGVARAGKGGRRGGRTAEGLVGGEE